MKLVYETIQVATLILIAYLVISVEKQFSLVKDTIVESQKVVQPLQKQLKEQKKLIVALQEKLLIFHTEVNERVAEEEKIKANIAQIKATLSILNEVSALSKSGQFPVAIEKLTSIKELLWKASDLFISEQAMLRGLMWPIDQMLEKLKSNDKNINISPVVTTIQAVLANIKS